MIRRLFGFKRKVEKQKELKERLNFAMSQAVERKKKSKNLT
jgi:hypothetical protein|tara:strand:+ start:233 stop:355 length:123 start_codon:yes stop_codon:yes gene_type:complete